MKALILPFICSATILQRLDQQDELALRQVPWLALIAASLVGRPRQRAIG